MITLISSWDDVAYDPQNFDGSHDLGSVDFGTLGNHCSVGASGDGLVGLDLVVENFDGSHDLGSVDFGTLGNHCSVGASGDGLVGLDLVVENFDGSHDLGSVDFGTLGNHCSVGASGDGLVGLDLVVGLGGWVEVSVDALSPTGFMALAALGLVPLVALRDSVALLSSALPCSVSIYC
nr:hypothetical protein [Tanacetum cinerariifolium]